MPDEKEVEGYNPGPGVNVWGTGENIVGQENMGYINRGKRGPVT